MTNTTTAKRKRRMAREPKPETTQAGLEHKKSSAPKHPTKTDKVFALLKRKNGATLDELVEATGWLTHTTRAALTGLRKKGHTIERTKVDGVSRYTVTATSPQ